MGFHHVALATRDTEATHRFYTEVMCFELVKVVTAATPGPDGTPGDGYSKHFFYDTTGPGGAASGDQGMIAFWEIHDDQIGTDFPVDINAAAGLPWWVNHIAFDAPTREILDAHRERWQRHGQTVLEVDHEFCVSIYIRDPSGNMVEFCHTTRPFTPEERIHAMELLADPRPPLEKEFSAKLHHPVAASSGEPVPEPVAGT
jgi:catechol 2,3-dioxygenase-like lactoylglutathione lyase family enzyme